MRKWLDVQKQVGRWEKASLRIMADAFPSGKYETWATCRVIVPHARRVLSHVTEEKEATLYRARIVANTARYLRFVSEYVVAENIGRAGLAMSEKVLGVEHLDTLSIVTELGLLLIDQDKHKGAELMLQRALKEMGRMHGAEHPKTLSTLSQVGVALLCQGKHKESESMLRGALKGMEKVSGVEDLGSTSTRISLAIILKSQSRNREAITLMKTSAQAYERVYGRHHPKTEEAFQYLNE